MSLKPRAHRPGYAVYSPKTLKLYDVIVLGLSNRFLWKCRTSRLEAHYARHLSVRHLDIGIGTGYFLDRARFSSSAPQITLLDPNRFCLEKAAERLARYSPRTVEADALVPLPEDLGTFSSVGLNYLFHCLPGKMETKAVLLDHLRPHLAEEAVVFGSTIVQGEAPRSLAARKLMAVYNAKGVFGNEHDTIDSVRQELSARFADVDVKLVGCVALFSARSPKP